MEGTMTHPRFPGPDSSLCVFWHDFERTDDTGLLWYDRGPNKLHATPQAGFAAPNYGLGRTARGKGYASFTGAANVYATLPLRFYDVAPTVSYTWVVVLRPTSTANQYICSCDNLGGGGINRGIILYRGGAPQSMNAYSCQGTAVLPVVQQTLGGMSPLSDVRVGIVSVAAAPASWGHGVQFASSWTAGSVGPVVYDTTRLFAIGASVGGGNYTVGQMFALILYRDYIPSHAEAVSMSRFWRDQV
jgi:hypothetical protein